MFFELFTTDFSSAPFAFWALAISLTVEKNLFLMLHGAFGNNKTINLLIGLLNQDPSAGDQFGSNSINLDSNLIFIK